MGGGSVRSFTLDMPEAVLPTLEIESHAGEIRDDGQRTETDRAMPVLAVRLRQPRDLFHDGGLQILARTFQGADANRKVAGDTGGEISRGTGQPFCFSRLNF